MSRKTGLKTKIIRRTSVIMILAMTISTLGAYLYFSNVVKKQSLRDEGLKLEQFADQIKFMAEDIILFSRNIIVDSRIQQVLLTRDYDSETDKVKANWEVSELLKFYMSLRNYIASSYIIDQDGRGYSSTRFYEARYYEDRLNIEEIMEYEADASMVFSRPYAVMDSDIRGDIICYKAAIRDASHGTNEIGAIYLEVYLSYFQKQIEQYAKNYEKIVWCTDDGTVLYDSMESAFQKAAPSQNVDSSERVPGGYVVTRKIDGTDWLLRGYVSGSYLRSQSGTVLLFFLVFYCFTLLAMRLGISPVIDTIIRPITKLTKVMGSARQKDFHVDMGTSDTHEIEGLYHGFNEMMEEINGYTTEIIQHEKQIKEMEFDIMLSQINPHYLYNVLNTVVYLAAEEGNDEVVKLVNALIGTLQESLKVGENNIYTTVEKEMELVKQYLTIQNYRYPDRMEVTFSVDESLLECQIPKTVIQPLVENSLIHGIIPTGMSGHIWIRVEAEADQLRIEVEDDGLGMEAKILERFDAGEELVHKEGERKHIGLQNIRSRVLYLYKEESSVEITKGKQERGTLVRIIIPKIL